MSGGNLFNFFLFALCVGAVLRVVRDDARFHDRRRV